MNFSSKIICKERVFVMALNLYTKQIAKRCQGGASLGFSMYISLHVGPISIRNHKKQNQLQRSIPKMGFGCRIIWQIPANRSPKLKRTKCWKCVVLDLVPFSLKLFIFETMGVRESRAGTFNSIFISGLVWAELFLAQSNLYTKFL